MYCNKEYDNKQENKCCQKRPVKVETCKHDWKEDYCKCYCKCLNHRDCKFGSEKETDYED